MEGVASDLISNIEGYQQLLTTLALGVAAGAFALLSQIIFHNAQHPEKIALNATWLVFVAIFVLLLSIGAGVMTKSTLVSSVPALHAIEWGDSSATTYLKAAGLSRILMWASAQIVSFGVGAILLFLVLLLNMKLLKK